MHRKTLNTMAFRRDSVVSLCHLGRFLQHFPPIPMNGFLISIISFKLACCLVFSWIVVVWSNPISKLVASGIEDSNKELVSLLSKWINDLQNIDIIETIRAKQVELATSIANIIGHFLYGSVLAAAWWRLSSKFGCY